MAKSIQRQLKDDEFVNRIYDEFNCITLREFMFHESRKWRIDFFIPEHKIGIEVEGAVWTRGRHTRGSGFVKDIEKYNEITAYGIRLLRTTPDKMLSTQFFDVISRCIKSD